MGLKLLLEILDRDYGATSDMPFTRVWD